MPNFLNRWWERRSLATPSPELLALFNSGPTDSGMTVSPQTALTVPAVFACVQVLSQDVARTPLKLRQKTGEDTYVDAVSHPLYELLAALPNPEMTAYQVKLALQWQLLTTGRAYAEIVRVDGRVDALWPLDSCSMRVDRDASRRKRWTYTVGWLEHQAPRTITWLFDPSAPPVLELVAETPITRCREAIGVALALQQHTATFFRNNGRPSGVLQAVGSIKDETAERLRSYWAANYGGSANRGKIPVLDNGLTFTAIQAQNDEAQLNEMMKAISTQICGAFRVPPWKAGLMESTNYSNMESGENAYVNSTLDPWFASWEEALRRDVLTTRQYGQFTIQFDRGSLVRNDVKALHDSLCQGIQNGIYSQNDARKKLGENPIPDGDQYLINSALQPVGAKAPNVA